MVGGPLGPLLRVDSLKVARQNPLILEMDLGLNANLGVVEVESVRVRMPIDPPGMPDDHPDGDQRQHSGHARRHRLSRYPRQRLRRRARPHARGAQAAHAGVGRARTSRRRGSPHHGVLPRPRRRISGADSDRQLWARASTVCSACSACTTSATRSRRSIRTCQSASTGSTTRPRAKPHLIAVDGRRDLGRQPRSMELRPGRRARAPWRARSSSISRGCSFSSCPGRGS